MKALEQEAKEIFDVHPQLQVVYITSDGIGYEREHNANQHAKTLGNATVQKFNRADFDFSENSENDNAKGNSENSENDKNDENANRERLFAEYEALTGQKPPHNIGTEKLLQKIADLKVNTQNSTENIVES